MLYRHLALATAVGALTACASTGSGTTDEGAVTTTTTATTDSVSTTTAVQPTTTDTTASTTTTVDSASARSTTDMAAGGEAMAAAQLDTMIAVAERGFTTASPTEAVNAITGFQSYVSSSGVAGLSDISTDLDALKSELQKPTPDQTAVKAALSRIAPKVSAAAASGGANSERLTRLGQAFQRAGGM